VNIGPEGRKSVAPAVRPGDPTNKSSQGPQGRKIGEKSVAPPGLIVTGLLPNGASGARHSPP